jgi:N-acetylneuraminic acid mutarotase
MRPIGELACALALASCQANQPPHDAGNGPGTWTEVRPVDQRRFEAAAATIGGKLYFFGGISDLCTDGSPACVVDRVDAYDPATQTWTPAPPLPAGAPHHHLSLAVVNDVVYVVGGFVGILGTPQTFTPVAKAWAFDGTQWTARADAPMARGAATAQVIDGKIYVAGGGVAEPSALALLTTYDPTLDEWSTLAPMPTAREHLASCVLGGQFVAIGGWRNDRTVVSTVEAYDPATDHWTSLQPIPTARGGLGGAVLDGTCYAIGGEQWSGPDPGTFADVQGLDALDGTWQSFAPLVHARHGIGTAALAGALYVVGGGPSRGNSYSNEVAVFEP